MRHSVEQLTDQAEVGDVSVREMDTFTDRFEQLPDRMKEVLGNEERRMLREVNQKHDVTFRHSLGVGTAVDTVWPAFADELEQEGVRYADMVRAATLHDVGKVALPDCVLKNTLKHDQLADIFMHFVRERPDLATEMLRRKGRLSDKRTASDLSPEILRGMDFRDVLPLDFLYREDPAAMAEIIQSGLDPHMSFMDALRSHEAKSKVMIEGSAVPNRELVSALAGVHHNYDARAGVQYRQDGEMRTVPVAAAEVLHLSDVFKAMTDRDQYQETVGVDEELDIILQMADQGVFNREVARRWVEAYKKRPG